MTTSLERVSSNWSLVLPHEEFYAVSDGAFARQLYILRDVSQPPTGWWDISLILPLRQLDKRRVVFDIIFKNSPEDNAE